MWADCPLSPKTLPYFRPVGPCRWPHSLFSQFQLYWLGVTPVEFQIYRCLHHRRASAHRHCECCSFCDLFDRTTMTCDRNRCHVLDGRLFGPFHGAIAVPSVTRCRCRCCRCRRRCREHRFAGGVRQCWRATVAIPGEWRVRRLAVANGPNMFQMLLVTNSIVVWVNVYQFGYHLVSAKHPACHLCDCPNLVWAFGGKFLYERVGSLICDITDEAGSGLLYGDGAQLSAGGRRWVPGRRARRGTWSRTYRF